MRSRSNSARKSVARPRATFASFASRANSVLFHASETQEVLPAGKLDEEAMQFARKCASFRAEHGRCGTLAELEGYEAKPVEKPVETVGLGDTLSCAYFLACKE